MIYTGDLVKINGNVIQGVRQYKIGRSKLWKNAERNMDGDVRATLIGIFPKIQLQTRYMTQDEMTALTQLLDLDYFNVTWFDVRIQNTITTKYYASDYDTDLYSKSRGLYLPMSVNLVPCNKRKY